MSVLLAAPLDARPQAPRLPVVAYVFGGRDDADVTGPDPKHPHARAFVHRLRELGWEDGRTIRLERYGPGNDTGRARAIFADLSKRSVSAIFAPSAVSGVITAKLALEATRSVPIVFAGGNDPVAMGLVASLARPGGNVTGMTVAPGPQLAGKRVELMRDIVPGAQKLAYFGFPGAETGVAREVAAQLKVQLVAAEISGPDQLDEAFARVTREKVDGLVIGSLGYLATQLPRLIKFAAERRIPAFFPIPDAVDAGGLASYAIDFVAFNRRAADYVDKILRGAKPGELPVEQPTKFEFAINLKTARALGLQIPQNVMLRADRVVE